jgi:hypothetical protein
VEGENLEPGREARSGFTMLDSASLVLGAAVGSVHLRPLASRGAWDSHSGLFWPTFLGVALTASGPFVFLERWLGKRPAASPHLAEALWAVLGLPWVLTSALRASARPFGPRVLGLYGPSLVALIGLACLLTLVLIVNRWIFQNPGHRAADALPQSWTVRAGFGVAVTWPLQYGFALVVMSPG